MTGATPGQAAFAEYYGRQAGAAIDMGAAMHAVSDATRADWEAAAQAAIDAATEGSLRACGYTLADVGRFLEAEAAAQDARPAPAPISHYCDSGNCDVCGDGTGDKAEARPAPEVALHQLSGLVAGWRQAMRDLEEQPMSSDEAAQYSTLREVVHQVLAVITDAASEAEAASLAAAQDAQPAPGYVTINARDIAIALNGYAGFTGNPVSFASELHDRLRRTVFADQPLPAPELADAMAVIAEYERLADSQVVPHRAAREEIRRRHGMPS